MNNLLVVDDEPDVRLMFRLALRVAGFDVDEAASGEDALRMSAGGSYDAVVLDIHLPDINGWEVLEQMRSQPSSATTPVVIVTADVSQRFDEESHSELVVRNHVRLMYKPLDPADLVNELEGALAETRSSSGMPE